MWGNATFEETARRLVMDAVAAIKALLPPGWDVAYTFFPDSDSASDLGYDASIVVRAPDRRTATFLTEVKAGRIAGADHVLEKLGRVGLEAGHEVLLVAPYIGPALRTQCEARGINYLDLTGWVWLRASAPAMAIRSVGAAKDPGPSRATSITRLSGPGAGRIIRALLAGVAPIGVRSLAERAAVSAGTVSKVLKELDSEAIVIRDPSGRVNGVRKRLLIARWTRDYSFLDTNNVGWYLAPRGIDQLMSKLSSSNAWAVETGLSAGRRLLPHGTLPVTGTSQIALYVPRASDIAQELGVVQTDRPAANVLLAEPYDADLLRQPDAGDEPPMVDAGQVIADLKTMPGRAAQAADQLMDAFATTDPGWR